MKRNREFVSIRWIIKGGVISNQILEEVKAIIEIDGEEENEMK